MASPQRPGDTSFHPKVLACVVALVCSAVPGFAQDVDFRQASNANFTGNPSGAFEGDVIWIGSILQASNSIYSEHMSVPQRIYLGNFDATQGNVHSLVFRHQAAKSGKHAYDYLTSWDQAVSTATQAAGAMNPPLTHDLLETLFANQCEGVIGPQLTTTMCELIHSGHTAAVDAPDDMDGVGGAIGGPSGTDLINPRIQGYEAIEGNRTIRLYGNGSTGFSNASLTFNGYQGNSSDFRAEYTLTWTSDATDVVVELAGHLAPGLDGSGFTYVDGYGAADISGGPYHVNLDVLDGSALGNQDNQIKAADIIQFPPPAGCDIPDPEPVCPGETFTVTSNPAECVVYEWSILPSSTATEAVIVGPHMGAGPEFNSITVDAGGVPGTVDIKVLKTTPGGIVDCFATGLVVETVPEISCPADASLEWVTGLDTSPGALGSASATDDCDPDPAVRHSDNVIPGNCDGNFVIERTWTATNFVGNTAMCVQTITVTDTTPPAITCPADASLDWVIGLDTGPGALGSASATDDCDPNPGVGHSDNVVPGDCDGNFVIERTWTATDECGNSSDCLQTITVADNTPPAITCPADASLDWVIGLDTGPGALGSATATDDCDPNPGVGHSDNVVPGDCDGNFVIERTWTATDECGNASDCLQTITVTDTTPPAITCPADASLDWVIGLDTGPGALGFASATDDCDPNPGVEHSDNVVPGDCDGNFVIERTWTATDECGNSSDCLQTITVTDTTPPAITCPTDASLDWVIGLDTGPGALGFASATDDCDPNPGVEHSDNVVPGDCDGNFVIERTWTATDECGNASDCLQTITVTDTTPPAITCPADASLDWVIGLDTGPGALGFASATDDCDPNPGVDHSDNVVPGDCDGNFVIERTWTATDECGNASDCLQTITVTDTTPPAITCPADASLDWVIGLDTGPGALGFASATDDCDPNPGVDHSDNVVPGDCDGNFVIERTWTATDECGNSSDCLQTITVTDTTPPAITCPTDTSLEWVTGLDTGPGALGSASATDDCDPNPGVDHSDNVVPGDCDGNFVIERTWTATDECGNSSDCLQTITVTDTTPPEITCPADASLEWVTGTDTGPGALGSASATDACDPDPEVTHSDNVIPGDCDGNFVIERTWTATDECGNASDCLQTITMTDNTPPEITCPADASLEWVTGLDTGPGALGSASATDACDPEPGISHSDNVIPGDCDGNFVIERTWTATDECGNASDCLQTITVTDTTPPEITCPADASLDWVIGLDTGPGALGSASATDACDPDPDISHSDNVVPGDCDGNFVIERTWTATDECGNASDCLQTITVTDTTPPAITCPADASLEWVTGLDTEPGALGSATATDDCDPDPGISHSDNVIPGDCDGNFVIERTWTATDECGNASDCLQTITVTDTTPPVITCPDDVTICEGETGVATATDDCDPDPEITFEDSTVVEDDLTIVTRTWTATDECGNSSSCDQVITIQSETSVADLDDAMICVREEVTLTADVSGTGPFTYQWSKDGEDLQGETGPSLTVLGLRAGKSEYCVSVTGACNSASACAIVMVINCDAIYCTFTQGFWGNGGGYFNGIGTLDWIEILLADGPLVIGIPTSEDPASIGSLSIPLESANCIIRRLPAGGKASAFLSRDGYTGDNVLDPSACQTVPALVVKAGKFRNVLMGQTIALGLNLELDAEVSMGIGSQLANVELCELIGTVGVLPGPDGVYGTSDDEPVRDMAEIQTCSIPGPVLHALDQLGARTVGNLFVLANRTLSGLDTYGANASQVNRAVDCINNAFDECRMLVECLDD